MTSVPVAETPPRGSPGRRLSTFFYRHPKIRLAALLALPVGWLVLVYFGSLFVLLLSSLWETDPFTRDVVHTLTLENFQRIIETPVFRDVAWRTIQMAVLVTLADIVLAFPDRVLHGPCRLASHTRRPRHRSAHAALGQLPREGLRLADDPLRRRGHQLGARSDSALVRRVLDRRTLAHLHVPLAAVHDPADLRRPRADPGLAARGVGRSRRALADHVHAV